MDANNNDVDAFIKLAERDIKNEKTPEQAYIEKFGIMPASQLLGRNFEPLTFLYDGLIPSIGLTLIAALPKTGKSFFVLNLAAHMDNAGVKVYGSNSSGDIEQKTSAVTCNYISVPTEVSWAANSNTGLYDAANSVNFPLHESEETELVIKILALAGIILKDNSLYSIGSGEDVKNAQQEKS